MSRINIFISKIYTKLCRVRIKNYNFTILSNCCISGSAYKRLGLPFLTPTINVYIEPLDFVKFLSNIEYYLSLNLEYYDEETSYPNAYLGDIKIHFYHSKNFDEANNDWNRRKNRINFNNLYIIIRDLEEDVITPNLINNIKLNYRSLVILKKYKVKDKRFKQIKIKNEEKEYYKDRFNIHIWEKRWKWIKFLNTNMNLD